MKIYLPKIVANSPTNLPVLEKTILYYIIHKASINNVDTKDEFTFEININKLILILKDSTLDFIDINSQIEYAINNLNKIKLSLVDNKFHLKVSPVESIYLNKYMLYVTINPIFAEYLNQVLCGNYVVFDLLTNEIQKKESFT